MAEDFTERRWTSPDGLSLYARDYPALGEVAGLPVVCLHGFTRNSRDFEELAPLIAETGRRVVAIDMRGRGRSDRDSRPANYQPKVYGRDVLGFLAALEIDRAVFLGTSMGGLVILAIALIEPKVIGAAILNDIGPAVDPAGVRRILGYAGKAPPVRNWQAAAAYVRSINQAMLPHLSDEDWLRLARRAFRDGPTGPVHDYDPAVAPSAAPGRIRTGLAGMLAWLAFRRIARRVPTLLIRGERSDILSAAIAEKMKRQAPALEVMTIPTVGHAPLLDEPEALAAIRAFLQRAA